jgi:hypothetical protein
MDASETPHHDPADDDPARSDRNHAHSLPRRPHRPRTALAPAHQSSARACLRPETRLLHPYEFPSLLTLMARAAAKREEALTFAGFSGGRLPRTAPQWPAHFGRRGTGPMEIYHRRRFADENSIAQCCLGDRGFAAGAGRQPG